MTPHISKPKLPAASALLIPLLLLALGTYSARRAFADPSPATYSQFNGAAAAAVSSGTTITLSRLGSLSTYALTLGTGTSPYTCTIVISDTGIHPGDVYFIPISYPASTVSNIVTFLALDSSTSGALLHTSTSTAIAGSTVLRFVNISGTQWSYTPEGAILARNLAPGVQTALSGSNAAAALSGTAWQLGLDTYTLEQTGTTTAQINAFFGGFIHNAHLVFGGQTITTSSGTPLLAGSNTWLDGEGGGVILAGSNSNCTLLENAHQRWINNSGSANTETLSVSATSPLIGDQNILVTNVAFNGNRAQQTSGGVYGPVVSIPYTGGTYNDQRWTNMVDMSGVQNLSIRFCTFTQQTKFCTYIGNTYNFDARNLLFFKPALSATNSQSWGNDDTLHFHGNVIGLTARDIIAHDNNDNSPGFNFGEDVDNGTANPYSKVPWADVGPGENILASNIYTNGNGPGFYTSYSADPNLASPILHATFENFYLDDANPFRAQALYSAQYLFAGSDVHFKNWYISPNRGDQEIQFSGSWNNLSLDGINCPLFSGTGPNLGGGQPFIQFGGGGNFSGVQVVNCNVTGTGGTNAFVQFYQAGVIVNGARISGNLVNNMGAIGYNEDVTAGQWGDAGKINNIGGDGNIIINPTEPPLLGSFANPWGQLAQSYGSLYAKAYLGRALQTGTSNSLQNGADAAGQTGVSNWIQALVNLGYYNRYGLDLIQGENNDSLTQPVGNGFLWNSPLNAGGAAASTGTGGLVFGGTNYLALHTSPPGVNVGGAYTVMAVESTASVTGTISGIAGLVGTENGDRFWLLHKVAFGQVGFEAINTVAGEGFIYLGTTNSYINQPMAYVATYTTSGTATLSMYTLSSTGATFVSSTTGMTVASTGTDTGAGYVALHDSEYPGLGQQGVAATIAEVSMWPTAITGTAAQLGILNAYLQTGGYGLVNAASTSGSFSTLTATTGTFGSIVISTGGYAVTMTATTGNALSIPNLNVVGTITSDGGLFYTDGSGDLQVNNITSPGVISANIVQGNLNVLDNGLGQASISGTLTVGGAIVGSTSESAPAYIITGTGGLVETGTLPLRSNAVLITGTAYQNGPTVATAQAIASVPLTLTGTLVSGTAALTSPAISTSVHPWVQLTSSNALPPWVTVSGSTAKVTAGASGTATFTLFVPQNF